MAARAGDGGIELRNANGEAGDNMAGESFSVTINTTTGEVDAEEGAASGDIVDWLRQQADGELLDVLDAWLVRAKGYDPEGQIPFDEMDPWEPGDMLCYGSVYPRCREDRYPLGSRIYSLFDLHCPDPSCDCGDVILAFREDDGISDEHVGAVCLTLAEGSTATDEHAVEYDVDGIGPRELLERLYSLFRARYPGDSFLRRRQDQLKTNSHLFPKPPQRRVSDRISRNAPCPCGSGKKYKKCCLQL